MAIDCPVSMDDRTYSFDDDETTGVLTRRELDTTQDAPATQIVEVVADLEDCSVLDLSPIYDCLDGMIADLFSSPPPADAEAELEFTYQGYRIHVSQDGTTTVRRASG